MSVSVPVPVPVPVPVLLCALSLAVAVAVPGRTRAFKAWHAHRKSDRCIVAMAVAVAVG